MLSPVVGQAVGRYRILSCLGAGGMGMVFSAHDSTLGRIVALKFLKGELAADGAALERFRREARTLSTLNHPNICTIYDISEADGETFIAMELVRGQTLEERIGDKGLKLSEVMDYAAQIADAMAQAHQAGIIHRDLKPANVMVTEAGRIKLLDFGIAKLAECRSDESACTITLSAAPEVHTQRGTIVGTIAYLSPEQAEGKAIDARSDVFSFGAVLYEMITGVKAFLRESRAATLAAILNEEPKPLRELAPGTPAEVEKVVTRCLRKDRERRLRSMADLSLALREILESDSGPSVAAALVATGRKLAKSLLWAALTGVAVLATVLAWWRTGARPETPAALKVAPLTAYPGVEKTPSLSPDGSQVAFSWDGEDQRNFDIYVKTIGPGPPLRLTTDPAEDYSPAWSPDGSTIAFLRRRGAIEYSVIVKPALGGVEREVTKVVIENQAWTKPPYLSWLPDSQTLVMVDRPGKSGPGALFAISLRTEERTQLTFPRAGTVGDGCASVSSDGNILAFCRAPAVGQWTNRFFAVALGPDLRPAGEPVAVGSACNFVGGTAWSAEPRRLVYGCEGALWSLTLAGSGPLPAEAGHSKAVRVDIGNGDFPAVARRGRRLVFTRGSGGDTDIWRMRIPGSVVSAEQPVRLIASTRNEFAQQYSPDGTRIAFESDRAGNLDIWTCDSQGGNCVQLTSMGSPFTGVPAWSPDGRQIAFYSQVDGKSQIFTVGAEGGVTRRLTPGGSNDFYPRWSRTGQQIYFASNRSGTYQVWRMPSTGGTATQVTHNGGFAASESPDGRWLYFTRNESSDSGLWRMAAGGGDEQQVLPTVALHNYALTDDGLYFTVKSGEDYSIRFYSSATDVTRTLAPVRNGYVGFSVSPDKKWILYTESNPRASDLFWVDDFR